MGLVNAFVNLSANNPVINMSGSQPMALGLDPNLLQMSVPLQQKARAMHHPLFGKASCSICNQDDEPTITHKKEVTYRLVWRDEIIMSLSW